MRIPSSIVPSLFGAAILLAGPPATAQVPASPAAVFESTTLLRDVSLSAPLSDLFLRTESAMAKRDVGSGKPSLPTVKGTLRVVNAAGAIETFENVVVEPRGNSSLLPGQCTFSKLTLKFPKSTKGTSLGGLKTIKLGTHCGETDALLARWNRVGNENEPIREALAYAVLRRVGVVSLLARPIEITYTDTSKQQSAVHFPRNPLTRKAFLLEDESTSAKRYGGSVLQKAQDILEGPPDAGDRFKDATSSQIDPANVALAVFSEALLDNVDYFVRLWPTDSAVGALEGFTNYNVNIITDKDKHRLVEVYDWDTAGWVTGPIDPKGARFPAALARVRAYPAMTTAALGAAIKAYADARDDLYGAVDTLFSTDGAPSDPEGRANIHRHLDDFFGFLMSLPTD
jgi:hypothetical protein